MIVVAPLSHTSSPLHNSRVVTLFLEGELGQNDLQQIGQELFRIAHRGQRQVVLDLTDVSHLDYRGVKPLAARADLFRQAGGDIKICGASPYIAAIFRAAGVGQAFEFFQTLNDARAAFDKGLAA
jgi:anti-anti-sigma factor